MKRVILSGGGTGGHIYPAVAVAEALKSKHKEKVEILFVGAEGKMEMEKIPALGYDIVGLPIAGMQRRFDLNNLLVPWKVVRSVSWRSVSSATSRQILLSALVAMPALRCCGRRSVWVCLRLFRSRTLTQV